MSEENTTSGILEQALQIRKTKKKDSTHFVLCNGEKIRYIVAPDGGKKRLSQNISTYSGKLGMLMKYLKYIPFWMLEKAGMGYFAAITLHPELRKAQERIGQSKWNMIVGTYDEKQKLVMQCFNKDEEDAIFIKIGNSSTAEEINAEMEFLGQKRDYRTFEVPKLIASIKADGHNPFNMQLTKEFKGEKVEPILTEDIIRIYEEISETNILNGSGKEGYVFSHGDFAPWNLKRMGKKYVVFDWEHCGENIEGYDLMYYAVIIEISLSGLGLADAMDAALEKIRKYRKNFSIDEKLFAAQFKKTVRQLKC